MQYYRDISSSQQNFFRLLDQKIEQGADYDSGSETEMALEEARLNTLGEFHKLFIIPKEYLMNIKFNLLTH